MVPRAVCPAPQAAGTFALSQQQSWRAAGRRVGVSTHWRGNRRPPRPWEAALQLREAPHVLGDAAAVPQWQWGALSAAGMPVWPWQLLWWPRRAGVGRWWWVERWVGGRGGAAGTVVCPQQLGLRRRGRGRLAQLLGDQQPCLRQGATQGGGRRVVAACWRTQWGLPCTQGDIQTSSWLSWALLEILPYRCAFEELLEGLQYTG